MKTAEELFKANAWETTPNALKELKKKPMYLLGQKSFEIAIKDHDAEIISLIDEMIDKHRHLILTVLPEGIIEHQEHRLICDALTELKKKLQ